MEFLIGIGIVLGWIIAFPIARLVFTIFHEMGHAIPALLFSDGDIDVYIGSYGGEKQSLSFTIGRLNFFFRFDIFDWQIGMCVPHGMSSIIGRFFIVLGGPIASISIMSYVVYFVFKNQYSESVWAVVIALFLLALLDLIINLIPNDTKYTKKDGMAVKSDGGQLLELFRTLGHAEELGEIEKLYYEKKYSEVKNIIENKIEKGESKRPFYDLLIKTYQKEDNALGVVNTYEKYVGKFSLRSVDYKIIGLAYVDLHRYEEAIKPLNEFLYSKYNDHEALYARAVCRIKMNEYEEAFKDFKSSYHFSSDEESTSPLAQMAYLYLRENNLEQAELLLNEAAEKDINGENVDLQYYLAMYNERIGNYQMALDYYRNAQSLGHEYHGFEYKIYEMEEKLK